MTCLTRTPAQRDADDAAYAAAFDAFLAADEVPADG